MNVYSLCMPLFKKVSPASHPRPLSEYMFMVNLIPTVVNRPVLAGADLQTALKK